MRTPLRSIALALMFFVCAVYSQDLDNVQITGKITDTNGAAVAGATVTATLTETGATRTVTTDAEGRYRLVQLKPGIYKISAVGNGFGAKDRAGLQTLSGQNVQLDFQLDPAGVTASEVVVADDEQAAVDTTRTVVGGTISEREIEEIPNTERNALDLVLTLGGTAEESLSTNGLADDRGTNPSGTPLEQGNFSLSGGTAYSNNITIDGLDNNDDRSSRDRFQPSLESVAEVQVITNQFSAEYGRASGGRVNIRTRAGGSRFRGRAFMFFRDARLNANTYYNNLTLYNADGAISRPPVPRPPFTDWDPGFTLSGPVILPLIYNGQKRTFFSATYEYSKYDDTTQIDAYLPATPNPFFTLPAPTGSSRTCDNTNTAADSPACNAAIPTAGFVSPYSKIFATPSTSHVFTARVDHKLFKNNDLTIGFQYGNKNNARTNGSAVSRLEEAFQESNKNTDAYNFTDNHVFGARAVNQIRGQWSRYEPSYQTADPLVPVVLVSYRDPVSNSLKTLVAGNSTTSTSLNFADSRKETRFQLQDSLTYILGRHTLKGGFDVQNVNSKVLGLGDATGTFNFGSVLNYSNNVLSRFRQNFGTGSDVKNTYYGFFINDEMRPASNWTLSYGVRYERETAVSDNNNWGPRLGIAWDPFKKGKGVIRFGAGIFYNRVLLRTVADSIQNTGGNLVEFDTSTIGTSGSDTRRTAILAAIAQKFPNSFATTADLKSLIAATCPTVSNPLGPCNENTGFATNVSSAGNPLRSVEPDLKIPESYQYNVGFEREIGKGYVFEANYTINKTVRLWRDYNPNAPILPSGYADWTDYLIHNPFELSSKRKYTFYLGKTSDGSGITTTQDGTTNCGTSTPNCFVNLNTTNSSTTAPAVAVEGQNNNATGAPVGIALAAIAKFRPDQTVEETSRIGSYGNAFYHGLILEIRSRFRNLGYGFGAALRANYTLSSTKDDGLNNTANAEINGDFDREWARNLQDRRHRVAISGTFQTPRWFGRLKFSPLMRYGSSAPFNLGAGGSDRNLDDLGTDRLNFSGNTKDIVWRESVSPVSDALISQFSLQPIGAKSGNLPRNAGHGPSLFTFDMSVTREWKFGERRRLRPVIEFDNIFNATVFSYGAEFVDFQALRNDGTEPTATQKLARQNFLVPTRTYRQRQIRLGIRFDF